MERAYQCPHCAYSPKGEATPQEAADHVWSCVKAQLVGTARGEHFYTREELGLDPEDPDRA